MPPVGLARAIYTYIVYDRMFGAFCFPCKKYSRKQQGGGDAANRVGQSHIYIHCV